MWAGCDKMRRPLAFMTVCFAEVLGPSKVMSNGMWKCGTDQSGVQYKVGKIASTFSLHLNLQPVSLDQVDPAPWHVKHCFCTPESWLQQNSTCCLIKMIRM